MAMREFCRQDNIRRSRRPRAAEPKRGYRESPKEDPMPEKQPTRVSRRSFYKLGAGWMACAATGVAQQNPGGAATLDRLLRAQTDPNGRILLQGGVVLSLDAKVGDFEKADVLIEGKRIAAVGPNLAAAARSALVV